MEVPEAQHNGASKAWVLFNDFVVRNISQEEALSFPDKWKVGPVYAQVKYVSSTLGPRFLLSSILSE